ncbi:MAG: ComEC family competence protein [Flavobacteriales bacterium]|nr:ComEC family competence protein [Flavobacteriales bacterium]MCB9196242.1 ComEC family competence protein [Flavobacteriales bacterium]
MPQSPINWKNAPLIRLIIPMITGILIGIYSHLQNSIWLFLFLISFGILSSLLILSKKRPSIRKEFIFGMCSQLTFLLLGINLIIFKTAENQASHYQKFISDNHNEYIIEVTEIPKEKENSYQIIGEVTSVKTDSTKWSPTSGEVLLYFKKDGQSEQILQGDKLIINCNFQEIQPPQNPDQFNYKQYLSFNQIYQQAFVETNNWTLLSSGHFSLIGYASHIRDQLLQTLKTHGLSGDELAVASALILGYKDDLDNELKHSYSSAGATHVLAVSGLHVGIIFIAISFILGVFDKREKLTFTRLFIVLLVLWFYATITGLSPSVVRAATMFSFVAIGKAFQRDSNIYNTLAGSALVLLIYNPYLIMEVGFQLSYLAVLGIVYFQTIIYKRIYVKNKILDYIWSITSVSIAAQLTTFPLGLLYFHQFPTYFFISNLVVIPAAMIIIALGIGLFITSWIPIIAGALGFLLSNVIFGMNWVVRSIDQLPVSLIEGISITILECWIIYCMIIFIGLARETHRLKYLNVSLVLFSTLLILDHTEDISHSSTREIVIYSIKDEPNINFINGNSNLIVCSNQLFKDQSSMLFNIQHHWFDLDLDTPSHYVLEDSIATPHLLGKNGYYQFEDLSIYHFSEQEFPSTLEKVDILYISSSKYVSIHDILEIVDPKTIVLSNGCHWKYNKEVEILFVDNPNSYHDVKKQGAYVKSF